MEKVEDINVRGRVLTKLPRLISLKSMPPSGAIVSKTKPNIIKEPIFAIESFIAADSIGSAIRIN